MSDQNPYSAPTAQAALTSDPPVRWRIGVLALVALQIVLSIADAPTTLGLLRGGDITAVPVAVAWLSLLSLTVGGVLLLATSRTAIYPFGTSALLGILALLQRQPPLAVTGVVIALVASFLSVRLTRAPAKV